MLVPASRTLRARTGSRAPHKAKEHAVSGKVSGVHGEIGAAACVRDGRTRGEIAVPSFCILATARHITPAARPRSAAGGSAGSPWHSACTHLRASDDP